jgi:predicted outer membrane repeat protein
MQLTLNGTASITGNTAGGNGGGVYNSDLGSLWSPPVLVVNDLATITGNTPNDIYP